MTDNRETTEKSISETEFRQIWQALNHNQQRFAVAALRFPSKSAAAISIGVEPDTVYRWNGVVDDAVQYMKDRAKDAAIEILTDSAVEASMVKRTGLASDDERIRQATATEVLDRVLGKPTQNADITTKGESLNEGRLSDAQRAALIAALLERAGDSAGGSGADE